MEVPPTFLRQSRLRNSPIVADSLSVMTASIAHEVSQPLSGILTNANACLRMLDAIPPNLEGARETVRRTIRDANRAAEIIDRLRALFARGSVACESVDINKVVMEAVSLSRGQLDSSQVTVACFLGDRLPSLSGDRVQLLQVVQNLVRNAAEAMMEVPIGSRWMTVKTERSEGDQVHLSVCDAGVGFHRVEVDKLFTPFYTTKSHGMGIGLAVSRSIVEHHGGRLWGTPNVDRPGATFSFSVPARDMHVDRPRHLALARIRSATDLATSTN